MGKSIVLARHYQEKITKTMICPKCGMMKALDTVRDFYAPGMTDQQWKQYKEEYMLKYIKEN